MTDDREQDRSPYHPPNVSPLATLAQASWRAGSFAFSNSLASQHTSPPTFVSSAEASGARVHLIDLELILCISLSATMSLEATMLVLDNSSYSINGDYTRV